MRYKRMTITDLNTIPIAVRNEISSAFNSSVYGQCTQTFFDNGFCIIAIVHARYFIRKRPRQSGFFFEFFSSRVRGDIMYSTNAASIRDLYREYTRQPLWWKAGGIGTISACTHALCFIRSIHGKKKKNVKGGQLIQVYGRFSSIGFLQHNEP